MKTAINLRLSGAKSVSVSTRPDSSDSQAKPAVPTEDNSAENSTPQETDGTGDTDATASKAGNGDDGSKAYATVTKSWTSGGITGTEKDKVSIVATYPAVQDTKTGTVSLGASSFALTVTDLDTNVSSTIDPYAFSNTDWVEIPRPANPQDVEKFHVKGNVKIDVQTSGKMMRVQFHLDTTSHLSDIGYIFVLDIPENTRFTEKNPSKPSS
jgi:hypothetical protein